MRGAFSEIEVLEQGGQMRLGGAISNGWPAIPTLRSPLVTTRAEISARLQFDFFLFYLTRALIFDNQHGLLKKFDSAQAAQNLVSRQAIRAHA